MKNKYWEKNEHNRCDGSSCSCRYPYLADGRHAGGLQQGSEDGEDALAQDEARRHNDHVAVVADREPAFPHKVGYAAERARQRPVRGDVHGHREGDARGEPLLETREEARSDGKAPREDGPHDTKVDDILGQDAPIDYTGHIHPYLIMCVFVIDLF